MLLERSTRSDIRVRTFLLDQPRHYGDLDLSHGGHFTPKCIFTHWTKRGLYSLHMHTTVLEHSRSRVAVSPREI